VAIFASDRERPSGAQAASKTDIPTHYTQCRTPLFDRERSIHATVRLHQKSRPAFSSPLTCQSSYLISDNVVFLTIADKSYPRKLAFSFLDELSKEFATSYGPKVEGARKPYAFVGFGKSTTLVHGPSPNEGIDTFMAKTARLYQDTRTANAAASGLDKLNDELQDVTRIMTKNMEELLWRGDSLDSALIPCPSTCLN
jgi:hypothetical protein